MKKKVHKIPHLRKLSTKISLAILVGTLAILAALSFLAFFFTKSNLEESIMAHQMQTARQTMNEIDRILNERVLNIQTIAGAPPIQNALISGNLETGDFKKIALKRINEFTTVTGPWDLLMLVDREGKIVISSDEKQMGRRVEEQPQNKIAYESALHEDYYNSNFGINRELNIFEIS